MTDKRRKAADIPAAPGIPAVWLEHPADQRTESLSVCAGRLPAGDLVAERMVFTGEIFTGTDFHKAVFEQVLFDGCTFSGCDFDKASFVDVVFRNCDISNSGFVDGYFNRCAFRSVKAVGTEFREGLFKEVSVTDSNFSYANMDSSRWECGRFESCDMSECFMTGMKWKKISAAGSRFKRTSFFHTPLKGIDLRGNELENIILSDTGAELKGAVVDLYQAADLAKLLGVVVR